MLRFYQQKRVPDNVRAAAPRSFDLRSVATRRLRTCGTLVLAACVALVSAQSAAVDKKHIRIDRRRGALSPVEQTALFLIHHRIAKPPEMARTLEWSKERSLRAAVNALARKGYVRRTTARGTAIEPRITPAGKAQLYAIFLKHGLVDTLDCSPEAIHRTYERLRGFATADALRQPLATAETCSIVHVLEDAARRLSTTDIIERTGLPARSVQQILTRELETEGSPGERSKGYFVRHRSEVLVQNGTDALEAKRPRTYDWELAKGDRARTALAARLYTRGFLPELLARGLIQEDATELPPPPDTRRPRKRRPGGEPSIVATSTADLSPKMLSGLRALDDAIGVTAEQVSRELRISHGSAHHLLQRLVDARLATEHRVGKRGSRPLTIVRTKRGNTALKEGRRKGGLVGELAAQIDDVDTLARQLVADHELGDLYERFGSGSSIATSVLLSVQQGDVTPPDIDDYLQRAHYVGKRPYATLSALERAGLLIRTKADDHEQERVVRYALTDDGRLALGLWLSLGGFIYVPPRGD